MTRLIRSALILSLLAPLAPLTRSQAESKNSTKSQSQSRYEPACFGLFSGNNVQLGFGGYGGGMPSMYSGGGWGGYRGGYGYGGGFPSYSGAQFSYGASPFAYEGFQGFQQRPIYYIIQQPAQFGYGGGYGGGLGSSYEFDRERIRQFSYPSQGQFFSQPYPQLYGGGSFPAIQGGGYGGGFTTLPAMGGFSGGFSGSCPGGVCMPSYQAPTATASPQTPAPTKTTPAPKAPEKNPPVSPPAPPPSPQSTEVVPASRIEGMSYVYRAPSQPRSVDSSYYRQCVRIDTRGPKEDGYASGTIVGTSRTRAYILSCKHFIKSNLTSIRVHIEGDDPGQTYPAQVVSISPVADLSLLVIQRPSGVHSLTVGEPRAGLTGHMFGMNRSGHLAWRAGSRRAQQLSGYDCYDLFADLGDSGAALFSPSGQVLGVVSMSETSRTNCLAVGAPAIRNFLAGTICKGIL
jgi:hypothetical protein